MMTDASKPALTFQKTSDNVAMSLGVVFAQGHQHREQYLHRHRDPDNTVAASDGWVTSTADLSAYTGESIASDRPVLQGAS